MLGVGNIRFDTFFGPDWAIWTILGGVVAVFIAALWALSDAFWIPKWIRPILHAHRRAQGPG